MLTDHFTETEMGVALIDDVNKTANAVFLCAMILEPIRTKFGAMVIHSGYRPQIHNAGIGGKPGSFHLFEIGHCAADFSFLAGHNLNYAFDWIRLDSGLPFDKVILESDSPDDSPVCIHVQADRLSNPRREAYIGLTGACEHYTQVTVR